MMKGKFYRFHRVIKWFAIGLLAVGMFAPWGTAAIAQLPPLPTFQDITRVSNPRIRARACANLFCAPVRLDNRSILEVTSQPTISPDHPQDFDVQQRVQRIEKILMSIVAAVENPDTLGIEVGIRNDETVVYAPEQPQIQDQVIITITDFDSLHQGQSKKAIAKQWRDTIYQELYRSISERRAFQQYFWNRKLPFTLLFLGIIILSSWILWQVQKIIDRENQRIQNLSQTATDIIEADPNSDPKIIPKSRFKFGFNQIWSRLPNLSPNQKKQVIQFLRQVTQWGQIFIWLGGLAYLLYYYPATRAIGVALGGVPLSLLVYYLIVIASIKISHLSIEYSLQEWVNQSLFKYPNSQQRFLSRQITYMAALKGLASFTSYFVGILLTLNTILSSVFNIQMNEILTGVGVIGFALTYIFQSTIKDVLNGCLILWSDQYAVGDVIAVEDKSGLVEYINLYITQIRNLDGNLITIPNGSISIVENMTKNWSRVNFTIEVAYDSDIRKAMEVMKQVGEEMLQEPHWRNLILELPQVLGVDAVSHRGILVRIWITTQPVKQWEVGREFRCRVKEAFDREGIKIGIPQQTLWHQGYHHLLDQNGNHGGEFSSSVN
ncbi:mechanosensitive ion channel family protein [Limnospira sp. PMC 289.06]|uniref:mechanosensitive ion channel family protein n=1 Tax=Limnospira sp. PMC 289.06 TaxID=2981094 RepID=UPI0028E10CA6|nr:mechanosensitive ion channel family protein [Limnospira sp. PMC 289.06]